MWTLPNLITLVRILLLPVFLWKVWQNDFRSAIIIFFIAGISDGLDGLLARRLKQFSKLGEKLDPIADKLLLVSSFLILTIPGRGYEPIPVWLTATVILRDVFILLAALIVRSVTGFDRFRPSFWGKLSTTIQIGTILAFVVIHAFNWPLKWLLELGYILTEFMTVFSGLHYIFHLRMLMAEDRKEQA
ncbi:MAG TPA: CDP-alcohol phosphatidyltransferase family protein [Blastocatellia bacterium]|nr:CDP-alcohol phosphatidyltransferase family protein [Blastocatellia bacterium]